MTGIMVAVAGNTPNIIYAPGLFLVETGSVQLSPVSAGTSTSGSQTITRNWIGYWLAQFTGSIQLSIQTFNFAGSGGGSASTTGRLWFGVNAISGVNAEANITASGNQTINSNFNLNNGVYYPLRIRWNGTYSGGSNIFGSTNSGGGVTFLADESSDVAGTIFYNSTSNGF
jgi:hypothetical protein